MRGALVALLCSSLAWADVPDAGFEVKPTDAPQAYLLPEGAVLTEEAVCQTVPNAVVQAKRIVSCEATRDACMAQPQPGPAPFIITGAVAVVVGVVAGIFLGRATKP